MPPLSYASDRPTADAYGHQLFAGSTWHQRLLPAKHQFRYDYRYWGINISALARGEALPEVASHTLRLPLFSGTRRALQQFCPADYIELSDKIGDAHPAQKHAVTGADIDSDKRCDTGHAALHQRLCTAFETHTGSVPRVISWG